MGPFISGKSRLVKYYDLAGSFTFLDVFLCEGVPLCSNAIHKKNSPCRSSNAKVPQLSIKFCWPTKFRHREVLPIGSMWRLYIFPAFFGKMKMPQQRKHNILRDQPKYMDNCCNTRSYCIYLHAMSISSRRASFYMYVYIYGNNKHHKSQGIWNPTWIISGKTGRILLRASCEVLKHQNLPCLVASASVEVAVC